VWNLIFSKRITRFSASLLLATAIGTLAGCGGGTPGDSTSTPPTDVTPTPVAASLDLAASPTTVKSDGSSTSTITVSALNSVHAAVSGVSVTMGADTGILGAATIVTDNSGKATVSFSAGGGSINRTATITATSTGSSGTITKQLPLQIVGSTITLASSGSTLPDDGTSPVTLTVTALDAGGNTVQNAAVTLVTTGTANVTVTPTSGLTDKNGKFTAKVAGASGGAGTATVGAAALGAVATTDITVTPTAITFAIDQQKLNGTVIANNTTTAMKIGDSLEVRVNAPSSANVTFATSTGSWDYVGNPGLPNSVVNVPVVAGKATATLMTTQASVASVQVYDPKSPSTSDSLTVAMTSATAATITVQATPSVVPKNVGTTTGSSTLIAMVRDANGFPVGDAPVSFRIINPTGGGETVSPPVVLTASTLAGGLNLGEARTSFTSGSASTGAGGVQIRATVVGTAVETEPVGVNLTPSGNDAAIVIGGTAGSVAFGQATVLSVGADNATYILQMSVLVADSNGNPAPEGTVVNLSAWPIAWSTGTACAFDPDDGTSLGTFVNEDLNENLILDPGEDGTRTYYVGGATATNPGTVDTHLTPPNSAGGTLPGTVTTDKNGVAAFSLTYTKTSAIWTVTRIRARTVVQGSDAVGQVIFRLAALEADVKPCRLPDSPYIF
jgi:hypothetical protein